MEIINKELKTFQVWQIQTAEEMLLSEHEKLNEACLKIEQEVLKNKVCFLRIKE